MSLITQASQRAPANMQDTAIWIYNIQTDRGHGFLKWFTLHILCEEDGNTRIIQSAKLYPYPGSPTAGILLDQLRIQFTQNIFGIELDGDRGVGEWVQARCEDALQQAQVIAREMQDLHIIAILAV